MYGPHISKRSVVGWLYSDTESGWTVCNVSFVNERQQITWSHAQNVVPLSLRVLNKFVNSNSTLAICLSFDFIEMFKVIPNTTGR